MKNNFLSLDNRLIISLGLHSVAIIAFQLSLTQLLAIVQWHHFAYMIISIAMLGFGASGTLLALARDRLLRVADWFVPFLMTVSGLSMMVAFQITRLELFRFDVYLLFVERAQFPILAANYIIYFIPFFTGALAIGILFIKHASRIGTYYFSNLIGSGAGGLLVLFIFGNIYPQQVPPLVGLLSVLAGLAGISRRYSLLQIAAGTIAILTALLMLRTPADIEISEYKDLANTMNLPEAEIVHSQPDIHGLIEVAASPALRFAPALSLSYTDDVPVKKNVFVNGNYYGVIPKYESGQTSHILDYTTRALPWQFDHHNKILMLQAGEGAPLSQVFTHQPAHVDATITNKGVVNMLQNEFAEASGGLFLHDSLDIHTLEPRTFLASKAAKDYDLIHLPQQGAFGGTAGIRALQENYTMTLESFSLMWQSLKPDGMITVSAWVDYPARTNLKLLATLAQTARNHGIESPKEHIAAVRSWGTITYVLKKSPITTKETKTIREFCETMFFDPLLLPAIESDERDQFNQIEDDAFFSYVDRVMEGDSEFMESYGFMIDPATDNKPYFSQFIELGNLKQLSKIFGQDQLPFMELGYLVVLVTLVQSTILALLFILLPLFRLRKSHRSKSGTLLYFAALGLGYMFVEIILIQRFVLYFGQPVYALSAVISTMLIASSVGSLLTNRIPATPWSLAGTGMIIAILLTGYAFFLTPLLQWSIASPLPLKIVISLLLIGVPAFFKGMMFPFGIRYLSAYDSGQAPWAYGIDGSISVISTSLATIIAVESGFMVVMAVAVICYIAAFSAFLLHRKLFRTT